MDWKMNEKQLMISLAIVCLAVFLGIGIVGVGIKKISERAADNVIKNLQRDYAPGPYAPGFDPDKVDPNYFRQRLPSEQQGVVPSDPNQPYPRIETMDMDGGPVPDDVKQSDQSAAAIVDRSAVANDTAGWEQFWATQRSAR